MEEKLATIPSDKAHELRHQIYAWIIANGFAKDVSEAKLVAKQNGFLMNKKMIVEKVVEKVVEKAVEPKDYQEVKEKAAKWEQLKKLLS